jgi:hypothetical protein
MVFIPSDTDLQRMTNEQLRDLWRQCPKYPEDQEWVRVAKEVRYREKFCGKHSVFNGRN